MEYGFLYKSNVGIFMVIVYVKPGVMDSRPLYSDPLYHQDFSTRRWWAYWHKPFPYEEGFQVPIVCQFWVLSHMPDQYCKQYFITFYGLKFY